MVPVLMAGTLSMQGIIRAQGGLALAVVRLHEPGRASSPSSSSSSPQLAEGNRTPFDLPEAESELVAGYLSEYSGFRFALFFLVEFGQPLGHGAIATTLFLGGWQVPGVGPEVFAAARGAGALPGARLVGRCRSSRWRSSR